MEVILQECLRGHVNSIGRVVCVVCMFCQQEEIRAAWNCL